MENQFKQNQKKEAMIRQQENDEQRVKLLQIQKQEEMLAKKQFLDKKRSNKSMHM